jgi:hypothetical protein
MASSKNTTTSRPVCKFPGCEQRAATAEAKAAAAGAAGKEDGK